jgi:hypothetical protein
MDEMELAKLKGELLEYMKKKAIVFQQSGDAQRKGGIFEGRDLEFG